MLFARPVSSRLVAAVPLLLASLLPAMAAAAPGPASGAAAAAQDEVGSETDYGRTVLLLDSSGSMKEPAGGGKTKIAAARTALDRVIGSLPGEAEVGLRVFGAEVFSRNDRGACTDSQLVVEPGTDNRDDLRGAVGDYEPYGETPIPYALREAAKDLGNEGARSIVLVSDGESTCDPDPCEVAADIAKDGVDLQVDVVGLSVSGAARNQLRCIADRGNGTYYDADSAGDIESQLSRVARRAVQPFVLTGERINGGPVDNPTEVDVGDYVDRIGPEGSVQESRSFAVERETEGSTLRVSAVSQGQLGDDGLRVELSDPDGEVCDTASSLRQIRAIEAREIIGVQASVSTEDECAEVGSYRVTVTRRLGSEESVPFGLKVTEEPPVEEPGPASPEEAEVSAPQVSGPATKVVGGSSFSTATELGDGRWSSTIVPGEALMFRIPLEFGQAARVRVGFPPGSPAMRDVYGRYPPFSRLQLYNPMQASVVEPTEAETLDQIGDEQPVQLTTATPVVSRASYGVTPSTSGVEDFSMAGDYYLAVSAGTEDYTLEFPFTIEVEVTGEAVEGPTYAGDATWSVADGVQGGDESPPDGDAGAGEESSPAADADSGAEASPGDGDGDGGSAVPIAAGVGAGVLGLAAVIGGVLLWRRRAT